MITELAVAQVILAERNAKQTAEWRRQMAIADGGMAAADEEPGMIGKVVDFVQSLRNARVGQGSPALAGDAAA